MKSIKTLPKPINLIKLWDRLELKLEKPEGNSTFVTRIENIAKGNFQVECPVKITGNGNLIVGDIVEVIINHEDASYAFKGQILEVDGVKENLTTIKPTGKLSRIQRRKFVRLDMGSEVAFSTINLDSDADDFARRKFKGQLLNISAGGVLLVSPQKLSEGDYLLLNFKLKPGSDLENIIGIVKRVDTQGDEYLVGIEFLTREQVHEKSHWHIAQFLPPFATYFDDELEKHLVRFIYREQIIRKKSGRPRTKNDDA